MKSHLKTKTLRNFVNFVCLLVLCFFVSIFRSISECSVYHFDGNPAGGRLNLR